MKEDDIHDEFKFGLGQCKVLIKSYQRACMRKNSKHPAVIQLRCCCPGIDSRNWKYYLELWVNGEMKEQDSILPEAYDALACDDTLKKEELPNIEFVTLLKFTPANKTSNHQP